MEYEVSWRGPFIVQKTWIQRVRFAIWDLPLPFLLRRGFHWAVPWIGRIVTECYLVFAQHCCLALAGWSVCTVVFLYILLKMTCLLLPASNKKESEENEILLSHFPYTGMRRGLIKREKNPLWFSFMVFPCCYLCLESAFDVLEHWKISKGWWGFPSPDLLLCTSWPLNHRRNQQRKRDIKGQGSLNRKRRTCTGDLPLQYKCQITKDHTESQLDMKRGTASSGEVSGRLSWRSVIFFSVWFLLLVTCPFLCWNTEEYHFAATHFAPWELHNL